MFEVADCRPAGGDSDLSPSREPPNSYSKVGQYSSFSVSTPPSSAAYTRMCTHTTAFALSRPSSASPHLPVLARARTQNAHFCETVTRSPIVTQTALILNQTIVSCASRQQPVPPSHRCCSSSSSLPHLSLTAGRLPVCTLQDGRDIPTGQEAWISFKSTLIWQ